MKKALYALLLSSTVLTTAQAQWSTVCNTGNGFVVDFTTYHSDLYATGFFTEDCGGTASHINKWDGIAWIAADTGIPDPGHRVRVIDDTLYVPKYQLAVDSNWVYRWNGSHFEKFGQSLYLTTAVAGFSKTPSVYDIVKYDGSLVISGEFDRAGGKHISGVARWTGTEWDSLGSGLGGSLTSANDMYPHQMLVNGSDLYVVGDFKTAGGITVNGVARWDGTQWHAMGAGFNADVYAIAMYNDTLYAGGGFTMSGSTKVLGAAKWNGTAWIPTGFGFCYNHNWNYTYIHSIKQIGSHLFFSGGFDRIVIGADTITGSAVAAWNGTNIDNMSGGIPNIQVEALEQWGSSSLMAGGGYNNDSSHVAEYNLAHLSVATVNNSNIKVYPVPASERITVEGVKPGSLLELYDMPGRKVRSTIATGTSAQLELSALPAGPYLLRVSGNGISNYTQLVTKQ